MTFTKEQVNLIWELQIKAAELLETRTYTLTEFERLIEEGLFAHVLGLVCWYKATNYL